MNLFKIVAANGDPFAFAVERANVPIPISDILGSFFDSPPASPQHTLPKEDAIGSLFDDSPQITKAETSTEPRTPEASRKFKYNFFEDSPFSSPKRPGQKQTFPASPIRPPSGNKVIRGPALSQGGEATIFQATVYDPSTTPPLTPNAVVKKFSSPSKETAITFNTTSGELTTGYIQPILPTTPREIVYPLAQKGDLRTAIPKIIAHLKDQSPEIKQLIILDIFDQILCALKSFHTDAKKVHCDLKPENIFIFNTRTLIVADFGSIRSKGALLGHEGWTEGYMPQDVISGDKEVSAATDIWSVGQIFCEVLTGMRSEYKRPTDPVLKSILDEVVYPMLSPAEKDRASLSKFIEIVQAKLRNLSVVDAKEILTSFWAQII